MRRPHPGEIRQLFDFVSDAVTRVSAPLDVVIEACRINSDNAFVFVRDQRLVGVYAMLMLSPRGLERLLLGEFQPDDPAADDLVETGKEPVAIYKWAVVAPGAAAKGIALVSNYIRQPLYRHANLFARATTLPAIRLMENLGFEPVASVDPDLYRYQRLANRDRSECVIPHRERFVA